MTPLPLTDATVLNSLETLAADRATGALTSERGTFYLLAGHIAHVDSPFAPDLGLLLTGSGAVDPAGWREALDRGGTRRGVGRQLVDSGRLAAGALELCHLGVLFDAAYFALGDTGRAARFRPGIAHWLGEVRPVPVDTVVRESRRRREQLQRIWPEPDIDSAPLTRVPGARTGALPTRRGRTLAQVDGVRTAAEIASALAWRTFPTLVELRRLAADGLVTAVSGPPASPDPSLPWHTAAQDEVDTALLRRLRDALEAL
ncbi:hypothetical protein ACFV0T_21935 [Streptomyces sp. NPDC059582]|uniref:hypothetical protein n=1 Tax=Streptomyces sp. NPDC059582 TaxID=3346875 RepID=UPI003681ABCA